MSQTRRLSQLFAAESWLNNYRYLVNADFKAYDFDSLRNALLNYIQINYPEDFNDFINSSEYVALIDLLSFLGQNIAFRSDLNLRETFLETAEVRDNVLNIARQLGYRPFRNTAASGFLRIESVQTSQNVYDSRGRNLSGQTIVWADILNPDFNEQFSLILNEAFNKNNPVGRPVSSVAAGGVVKEVYELDQPSNRTMVSTFDVTAKNNNSYPCEIVPMTLDPVTALAEEARPDPYGYMTMLFNNDGTGFSNPNNGWFFMFKQGTLRFQDYRLPTRIENRVIDIDTFNINENDVWVQNIDGEGNILIDWVQVPSVVSTNVIFNNIDKDERNLFEVVTRGNDTISVKFGDDNFSNIPTDNLRIWFRQSANQDIIISSLDVEGLEISLRYVDSTGAEQDLIVNLSLNSDSVGLANENITQIKNRASRTAAAQDRMITANDYNSYPEGRVPGVEKIKSINRLHAGQSVYADLQDATGTYRPVITLADDAFIYSNETTGEDEITDSVGTNKIFRWFENALLQRPLHQLYYRKFDSIVAPAGLRWVKVDSGVGVTHGYFTELVNSANRVARIGRGNPDRKLRTLRKNTLFLSGGKWSRVGDVYREGLGVNDNSGENTGLRANGEGAVFVSGIKETANVTGWYPPLRPNFNSIEKAEILNLIKSQLNFGLRYDNINDAWKVIGEDSLEVNGTYESYEEEPGRSWLIRMTHNNDTRSWTYTIRQDQVVFGSKDQLVFHNQRFGRAVDQVTRRSVKDSVKVLQSNLAISTDITLDVADFFSLDDGRYDPKRVSLWLPGLNEFLVPDDPTLLDQILGSNTVDLKTVEFVDAPGQFTIQPIAEDDTVSAPINAVPVPGRQDLKVQFNHVPLRDNRVDAATTNIIDMFVLTSAYNNDFRNWISAGMNAVKPIPLTTFELGMMMSSILPYKSVSDTVVFHPVKYKILFGKGADLKNQATIRVTKSDGTRVSNAEIRNQVIAAIDNYFAADNWDFGETFYFTDMAAWVHQKLAGVITSIVLISKETGGSVDNFFQIKCNEDELFISSATVNEVEVITTQQAPVMIANNFK